MGEIRRQLAHMGMGLLLIASVYTIGISLTRAWLFVLLVAGVAAIHLKLAHRKLPITDTLIRWMGRKTEFPGRGAFWYTVGALALFSFLRTQPEIIASIAILALGDGVSGIVHPLGRIRVPWNRRKSIEGLAAFMLAGGLAAWLLVGPTALLAALLAGVVESLSLRADDNFVIPLVCIAYFSLA